jgi:hypothetical protein
MTAPNAAGPDVPLCGTCGRYPIDHRGGVCLYPPEIATGGLSELAQLIHFRVGAWEDLGYRNPPAPDCATVPPLGERSASAIGNGREAIGDIDRLIAQLHGARAGLAGQLRRDEDIRMAGLPATEEAVRWDVPPAAQDAYRAALELVREGLDIPHAKTVGDDEKRAQILHTRLIHVLMLVASVLDRDRPEWSIRYCREELAKNPAVGYHPNSEPIAYGMHEACAADGCGHRMGSHREHAEPEGTRAGCVYLGCQCTAYAAAEGEAQS